MGAGGSTDARSSPVTHIPLPKREGSAPTTIIEQPKGIESGHHSLRQDPSLSSQTHIHSHTPSARCCSHYKRNHARLSAKNSATHHAQKRFDQNSLDEEIEEIVANTLDLPNTNSDSDVCRVVRDSQNAISPNGSSRSHSRLLLPENCVDTLKRPTPLHESQMSEDETNDVAKESVPEVDFAKFKKVNHKDPPLQRNGRTIHHQDSDLLWRLGLISPEAYTHKKTTRSAPSVHGDALKPPSYDLTEEQLMANIEKEFAEYAATV